MDKLSEVNKKPSDLIKVGQLLKCGARHGTDKGKLFSFREKIQQI